MRLWGGDHVPFLATGGYYDQPYTTSIALEQTISAENEFRHTQAVNAATARALNELNNQG